MNKQITDLANKYISLQSRLDGGRNYKWEDAYHDHLELHKEVIKLGKACHSIANKLICSLLADEIYGDVKRFRGLIPLEKW